MDGKVIASVGWSGRSAARQADISPADREKHARLRAKRIRSFTQFILALSDQQLVTGLAILIAAVSGKNKLSKFEFSVAHSLAWFSSTTHLATLDVLRPALRSQNPWMLHTRVFGMVCVLALLLYTSVELALMGTPSSAFIPCAEDKQIPQNLLATIPTMLLIVSGYIIRLQDLYFYGRGPGPLLSFLRALRLKEHKSLTYGDLYARSLANTRCDLLMRYNLISGRRAGRVSVAYFWGYLQYGTAFLSTLPTIAFSFLYGIGQLVIRCWVKAPKLTPESREMGFGQIMALFLLILPILAAGEVFTGN
ncbi:uncharacterized protein CTRU02_211205 [Colletotrichum truncatum]|uniref:Uncharacterized protein n=1 Tax=Colletotrichum truncatum TaxID=5467 RepID=A0ACC3YRB5_COLTU